VNCFELIDNGVTESSPVFLVNVLENSKNNTIYGSIEFTLNSVFYIIQTK